jgi:uncharacterized membrane protein YheB (UPF0754 family)
MKDLHQQNMDVLSEISKNAPRELFDKLITTRINTEEEEAVKKLLKSDISDLLKEQLQKELDNGEFRHEEEVVDPEIEKKLNRYYEKEIKKAIKEGRLSKPDDDPMYEKAIANCKDNK